MQTKKILKQKDIKCVCVCVCVTERHRDRDRERDWVGMGERREGEKN